MAKAYQRERRSTPRLRVDLDGVIKSSERYEPLRCTVRDISENGARLQVENGDRIPDVFRLHLENEGFSAECIVVRRSETEVGVIFETAPRT